MKKKCLTKGMAAMALVITAASCSHDIDQYQMSDADKVKNATEKLGVEIDPNQDWNMTATAKARIAVNGYYGETYTVKVYSNDPLVDKKGYVLAKGTVESGQTFTADFQYASADTRLVVGLTDSEGFTTYKSASIIDGVLTANFGAAQEAAARGPHKSMATPTVANISRPSDEYIAQYRDNAVEATDDNSQYNNNPNSPGYFWWNSESDNGIVTNEFYVINYKITGEYSKSLKHLSSAGIKRTGKWTVDAYGNHVPEQTLVPRTVYVSGKWILNEDQTAGNGAIADGPDAIIIVADGGEIEINKRLDMSNMARLIVMPGGKITGTGTISVNNGNAVGNENYNGGTIDVGTFNNNFGKFYNYGTFKANEYQAGGKESNFYNHGVVNIDHSGIWNSDYYTDKKAPNARIFNACQWYCAKDMTARNIEMTSGSYMYVGRELMVGGSEDGTSDPSYVALASGALIRAGWLDNNGTTWQGPADGYAVLELGKVKYLNWDGDGPLTGGYFAGNIAVSIDNKDNNCMGKSGENAYKVFSQYVANGIGTNGNTTEVGNGGVVMVEKGSANVSVSASAGFEAGVKGCTPGYNGDPDEKEETNAVWSYAFEDTPLGDYDMNDVVIKVSENNDDATKLDVTLCCTGASFDLKVYLGETALFGGAEVHKVLGGQSGQYINTGKGPDKDFYTTTISKPAGFAFDTADFWVESPAVAGGVHIAKKGQDPHGIVIPADWEWPTEFTNIKDAYPNFIEFAKDASTTDEAVKGWYKKTTGNPVAGTTYKK